MRRGRDPEPVDCLALAQAIYHMAKKRSPPDNAHGFAGQSTGVHSDLDDRNDRLRVHACQFTALSMRKHWLTVTYNRLGLCTAA
jgi:hypothetical protein